MQSAHDIAEKLEAHHFAILQVVLDYPQPEFSGKWIRSRCLKLEVAFDQRWLGKLVNAGLLTKLDSSRGGNRRYYKIGDHSLVESVLALQPTPV